MDTKGPGGAESAASKKRNVCFVDGREEDNYRLHEDEVEIAMEMEMGDADELQTRRYERRWWWWWKLREVNLHQMKLLPAVQRATRELFRSFSSRRLPRRAKRSRET